MNLETLLVMKEQVEQARESYDLFIKVRREYLAALIADYERLEVVVDAAVTWRREGLKGGHEFAWRIDPLLEAVDGYMAHLSAGWFI